MLVYKDLVCSNIEILINNKIIAYLKGDYIFLNNEVTEDEIPIALFNIKQFRSRTAPISKFYRWLELRVNPETQDGINNVLDRLGIDEYNVIEMIKRTEGKTFEDNYRILIN